MKTSIVIVSYNAPKHLEICLDSCQEALKNIEGEIIVVDNNSLEIDFEFLKKKFPQVKFLLQKENLGFSKANNIGVKHASGEYILILNPDTIIPEDLFKPLIHFHQSKDKCGFIGVRMMDANGNFHPESKRNIPTAKNSFSKLYSRFNNSTKNNYYKLEINELDTGACEILVGAFMFSTKKIYQEVGGFDPRYFMYGEDIDLSFSTELAGYKNYYKGDLTILHYKGESTKRDKKYYKHFFEAMMIFLEKYYQNNWFNYQLLRSGIMIKYLTQLIKFKLKSPTKNSNNYTNNHSLYWLNSYTDLQHATTNDIVLDLDKFTYQEVLTIISENNSTNRSFFIRPKNRDYIIGDSKNIIKIKKAES